MVLLDQAYLRSFTDILCITYCNSPSLIWGSMHAHVADEVSLLCKLAPADMTLVGLLSRVDTHVLGEAVLPCEAHAALLAGKRLQAQMTAHVAGHGATLREHFAADVARERSQRVQLFVRLRQAFIDDL